MLDTTKGLTVNYHHGSLTTLNATWHDKNVICPNSKIYYVLDGEISVTTENEVFIARAGDAILIPEGVKHSYKLTESQYARKYWFHFDLRIESKNYFDTLKTSYMKHLGCSDEICELFETVVSPISSCLSVYAAIISIISIYTGGDATVESPLTVSDEIDKVISVIQENYNDKYDLVALAKSAGLSKNHFAKKFKEKTGNSPHKYINCLKLERAKFLLEYSDKNISEIMYEIGFLDAAHFSKLFRQHTGYSPTMFRSVIKATRKI